MVNFIIGYWFRRSAYLYIRLLSHYVTSFQKAVLLYNCLVLGDHALVQLATCNYSDGMKCD